jgi:hypothetical protein
VRPHLHRVLAARAPRAKASLRVACTGAAALAACLAVCATARAEDPPRRAPPTPAEAPSPNADEQASKWLKVGNAAFKAGDFAGAEKAYREAFAVKKGYDIAGDLGTAELAQGKLREAAQHFAYTLRLFPITGETAVREQMQKAYDQCRQAVGAVRVKLDVKGAQVLVDGALVGEAPLLDEVFVDPGEHVMEARLEGYTGASQRVAVEKGGRGEVTLVLTPIPGAVRTIVREVPVRRRSLVPGLALAGVAVVGLVGGGAMIGISAGDRSSASTLSVTIGNDHRSCITSAANYDKTNCANLNNDLSRYVTLHNAAVGAFIVGGAAAVGAVAYFVWPMKRTASDAPRTAGVTQVAPAIGPGTGGLVVSGAF